MKPTNKSEAIYSVIRKQRCRIKKTKVLEGQQIHDYVTKFDDRICFLCEKVYTELDPDQSNENTGFTTVRGKHNKRGRGKPHSYPASKITQENVFNTEGCNLKHSFIYNNCTYNVGTGSHYLVGNGVIEI